VLCRWHVRSSEKGGDEVGYGRKGKGTTVEVVVDAHGLPVAVHTDGADVHETRLVAPVLARRFVSALPARLGADKAYDSDELRGWLARRGIELIARHRANRVKPATQDGRKARRLKRRWKVERVNSWLKAFRRLLARKRACEQVRYEWHAANFEAFVHLACMVVLLRNLKTN
jgi:transposase